MLIDSDMTLKEALSQPHEKPAPKAILQRQRLLDVEYYSFEGRLHRGQIVVDLSLVRDIQGAFKQIKAIKFPIQSVIPISDIRFLNDDDKSALANNSSGFNYRNIAGTDVLSNHSFGSAIDINPWLNPYIRPGYRQGGEYNPKAPGTMVANSKLVKYFEARGWEWGGRWTNRVDYMHFEKPIS